MHSNHFSPLYDFIALHLTNKKPIVELFFKTNAFSFVFFNKTHFIGLSFIYFFAAIMWHTVVPFVVNYIFSSHSAMSRSRYRSMQFIQQQNTHIHALLPNCIAIITLKTLPTRISLLANKIHYGVSSLPPSPVTIAVRLHFGKYVENK